MAHTPRPIKDFIEWDELSARYPLIRMASSKSKYIRPLQKMMQIFGVADKFYAHYLRDPLAVEQIKEYLTKNYALSTAERLSRNLAMIVEAAARDCFRDTDVVAYDQLWKYFDRQGLAPKPGGERTIR